MPRWTPGTLYTNRNQWRTDPVVNQLISEPIERLRQAHFCDMNNWGELRSLVGGTTSLMTTLPQSCIHGLLRNLDYNSRFYGTTELNREHIFDVLDLPPADNPAARAAFVGAANYFISNPFYEALSIHLAEGTDEAAAEEFAFMQSQSLLNPKGVVIHGIPLTASDFQAMASNGTALVWSPRSNLELYGQTANINAALDAGVEIGLAPDWGITGSSNMMNELKVAARWNCNQLSGRLTDRQLVDMATSIPAHIAGIDDQTGAIVVGLRADIIVLRGDPNNPYRAIIEATPADLELVFIEGVPFYGALKFMKRFWQSPDLEEIQLPGAIKTLATPAANFLLSDIKSRLQLAMQSENIALSPLTEPDNFVLSANQSNPACSQSLSIRSNPATPLIDKNSVKKDNVGALLVTATPNPSGKYFTISTQSTSHQLLQVNVWDISGRILETLKGIAPNGTQQIGAYLRPGIYFLEVKQGTERQLLKLIRQ